MSEETNYSHDDNCKWLTLATAQANDLKKQDEELLSLRAKLEEREEEIKTSRTYEIKLHKKVGELEAVIAQMREALELIRDIAVDYDGYRKAESLMELIDELKEIAKKALDNLEEGKG